MSLDVVREVRHEADEQDDSLIHNIQSLDKKKSSEPAQPRQDKDVQGPGNRAYSLGSDIQLQSPFKMARKQSPSGQKD